MPLCKLAPHDERPLNLPMITPAEIERMTPTERLKTMEIIWDSLVKNAGGADSPVWHGEVLKGRLEKIRTGDAKFLDFDEARRRFA